MLDVGGCRSITSDGKVIGSLAADRPQWATVYFYQFSIYDPPEVTNAGGAGSVGYTTATLNGSLVSDGGTSAQVTLYHGPSDGGTNPGSWETSRSLGTRVPGPLSVRLSGLDAETTYYYRYHATNVAGEDWADVSTPFSTLAPAPLPFDEPFETLAIGALCGQNDWDASGAEVQSDTVYEGARAVALSGEGAWMLHRFSGGKTNVWTDLRVQPVFIAAADASAVNVPDGSSFAFYVGANGQVVAYDGTMTTQLVHDALTEGEWVRFTVHSDCAAKTWDLYVDRRIQAEDLGFYDAGATGYTEFGVTHAGAPTNGTESSYVDNIGITLTRPGGLYDVGMLLIVR